MSKLTEWIKNNVKDGADLAEVERLIAGENPLLGLDSTDKAVEFIKGNDILKRAFDSVQSKAAQAHDEKFMAEKLPNILKEEREKIRLELNPDEDLATKTKREFEEFKAQVAADKANQELIVKLEAKAAELEFDPIRARRYAAYGEKAFEELENDATWRKTDIETTLGAKLKEKFNGKPPVTSQVKTAVQISRADFDAMHPNDQAAIDFKETTIVD